VLDEINEENKPFNVICSLPALCGRKVAHWENIGGCMVVDVAPFLNFSLRKLIKLEKLLLLFQYDCNINNI